MWRRLLAEFTGTALLVSVVVGSGIAAQQLSPTDSGLQLLENSIATTFGLAALILLFGLCQARISILLSQALTGYSAVGRLRAWQAATYWLTLRRKS
jgi:glycerol uptake facilitator-like aquaporin